MSGNQLILKLDGNTVVELKGNNRIIELTILECGSLFKEILVFLEKYGCMIVLNPQPMRQHIEDIMFRKSSPQILTDGLLSQVCCLTPRGNETLESQFECLKKMGLMLIDLEEAFSN
jgi:hypothetical protein|uniref:Uncharacterized protein n=1 Tax=viral metagenome TaxID=1070528 RepID=A0A6C0BDI7_9ZZZZ